MVVLLRFHFWEGRDEQTSRDDMKSSSSGYRIEFEFRLRRARLQEGLRASRRRFSSPPRRREAQGASRIRSGPGRG